jgi:hypothetical protein
MTDSLVENEYIKVWINDGIMFSEYKVTDVNQEKALKMIETRLSLCKGKSYPFLADVIRVKSIDRAARQTFSHGKGIELMSACALIIASPVNQILGNFFMIVNKPNIPTKLFTSATEALAWLEKFK